MVPFVYSLRLIRYDIRSWKQRNRCFYFHSDKFLRMFISVTPPRLRPDYISDFSKLQAREVRYVLVVGFVFVFRSRLDTINKIQYLSLIYLTRLKFLLWANKRMGPIFVKITYILPHMAQATNTNNARRLPMFFHWGDALITDYATDNSNKQYSI